jgi:hypothetical protein
MLMSTPFDEAILLELDEALDFLQKAVAVELAQKTADERDARRKLRLFTETDLTARSQRMGFMRRSDVAAKEKYRSVANQIRLILSAWGDVPPQFAKFYVPEDVYDRLYPLYVKAHDRAIRTE